MAKLYVYYASMNAGKSTMLLQADFNYRERGMATMLFTAAVDDRFAAGTIVQAIETRQVARDHALRASLLVQLARRWRWLAGVGLALAGAGL